MSFNYTANARQRFLELKERCPKTVSTKSHQIGMDNDEPLIVMMDCLYRYAMAHAKRYDGKLCDDGVLGSEWLNAAKAVRALLDGDGAYALANDITTDSKDNGTVEAMFWDAMEVAGFNEDDMNV